MRSVCSPPALLGTSFKLSSNSNYFASETTFASCSSFCFDFLPNFACLTTHPLIFFQSSLNTVRQPIQRDCPGNFKFVLDFFPHKGIFLGLLFFFFTLYSMKTVICEIILSLIQTRMDSVFLFLFKTQDSLPSSNFRRSFLSHHNHNIYDSHPKSCHQIQQHRPNFRWDFHQHFHNVRMKSRLIQRCSCREAMICAWTTKQLCI